MSRISSHAVSSLAIFTLFIAFGALSPIMVRAESLPALRYKGQIMDTKGPTDRECDFVVAVDGSGSDQSFVMAYGSMIHGVLIEPATASFYYFDPSKPQGTGFYPVTEEKGNGMLVMSSIQLKSGSPDEANPSPNQLAEYIGQSQLESSVILSFSNGVTDVDYKNAVNDVLNNSDTLTKNESVLNAVDLMTVNMWHHNHADRARCTSATVVSVGVLDMDTAHDSSVGEDNHNHNH